MTEPSQPLFLFGPGYCALALAELWDGPVFGTYRSEESRGRIETKGISGVAVGDVEGLSKAIAGAHIVISTPPGEAGCPALSLIGQVAHEAASVTYLSTTGVYGDLDGGWAFEWTPVNPGSVRGQRRVEAEQGWQTVREDVRIVRLPGIYGPGRSPLDRVRSGRATRIIKPGQVFSRAHRDDIASGIKALIDAGVSGAFNLCDEEAAPPQDVTAYACELLDLPVPEGVPIEQAELSEMGRSFYAECKRVSNARLKAATGWRPVYPTYREGLQAILAAEQS
ncbi:SDR family NAD(P)-dependent oxidoreductase [Hyphomonas sp. FCG-A18]|uniref:SDR family NAD(P)-dependent oxidoreductase n=1 Tax=Hyphomonas sp. FCG-A18 TaxID=3080019 RepID=UPI002B306F04|nr:SDR family NAD(P)-dependent oxidoreductase [Hyphomonas sp. FCG-A18]